MSIQLAAAGRTDVGRVRTNNEDAFVIVRAGTPRTRQQSDTTYDLDREAVLLAVSDGMGGHDAGEVASAIVIDALARYVPAGAADAEPLRDAILRTHAELRAQATATGHEGMGATLAAALITHTSMHLGWVGDSRVYLVRGGTIQLLTHDQNVAQLLVDGGAMPPEQLEASPLKHVLASAMGHGDQPTIGTNAVELVPGDRIVLCSDGLTNELRDDELVRIVAAPRSCTVACEALIAGANRHGGKDNVTVIIAELAAKG